MNRTLTKLATVHLLLSLTVVGEAAMAAPAFQNTPTRVLRADTVGPLGNARSDGPQRAVAAALVAQGRSADGLGIWQQTEERRGQGGVGHVMFQQRTREGLPVHGAYVKAAIAADGTVLQVIDHLVSMPSSATRPAAISAAQALQTAAATLYPTTALQFAAVDAQGTTARFDGGSFFLELPRVTPVAAAMSDGTLAAAWLVETWADATNQLHHTLVGGDGTVLQVVNRTASPDLS